MDNKLLINEIINSEVNPYSYCEMFSSIINIMKNVSWRGGNGEYG